MSAITNRRAIRNMVLVAGGLSLAHTAYAATLSGVVRLAVARLRQGDVRLLLALYAKDVHFVFPGQNSWSVDVHSREEFRQWLERLVEARLQLRVARVLVSGPPWNTNVAMVFTDEARDPDGTLAYSNSGVVSARAVWGRIVEQHDSLDTQKVLAWDEHRARSAGQ